MFNGRIVYIYIYIYSVAGSVVDVNYVYEVYLIDIWTSAMELTTDYGILYITVFIHFVVCLTTGAKSLPKRAFHIVRSIASSSK